MPNEEFSDCLFPCFQAGDEDQASGHVLLLALGHDGIVYDLDRTRHVTRLHNPVEMTAGHATSRPVPGILSGSLTGRV